MIKFVLQQRTAPDPLVKDPYCALAATLLCEAFEAMEYVESPHFWTECERFVPHLMSIAKHIGTPTIGFLALSRKVGWYVLRRGRYDDAEALFQQALAGQEEQLGVDDTHAR